MSDFGMNIFMIESRSRVTFENVTLNGSLLTAFHDCSFLLLDKRDKNKIKMFDIKEDTAN